jgi:hypothetical protein
MLNPYTYVTADPINHTDPTGKSPWRTGFQIGFMAAGLAGLALSAATIPVGGPLMVGAYIDILISAVDIITSGTLLADAVTSQQRGHGFLSRDARTALTVGAAATGPASLVAGASLFAASKLITDETLLKLAARPVPGTLTRARAIYLGKRSDWSDMAVRRFYPDIKKINPNYLRGGEYQNNCTFNIPKTHDYIAGRQLGSAGPIPNDTSAPFSVDELNIMLEHAEGKTLKKGSALTASWDDVNDWLIDNGLFHDGVRGYVLMNRQGGVSGHVFNFTIRGEENPTLIYLDSQAAVLYGGLAKLEDKLTQIKFMAF